MSKIRLMNNYQSIVLSLEQLVATEGCTSCCLDKFVATITSLLCEKCSFSSTVGIPSHGNDMSSLKLEQCLMKVGVAGCKIWCSSYVQSTTSNLRQIYVGFSKSHGIYSSMQRCEFSKSKFAIIHWTLIKLSYLHSKALIKVITFFLNF